MQFSFILHFEKIRSKIGQWATKHLSYAGRLQLIKSVVYGMLSYWCRQVMLPKAVIRRVEQLCLRFFWKGNDTAAKGARVKWEQICLPKAEGGLGLKSLQVWNEACMLGLMRNLLATEGSLWVAWVHEYAFHGIDFWDVESKSVFSWTLRKILKLRSVGQRLFADGAGRRLTSVKDIWAEVRERHERVAWQKLIWFPCHIPKFSIILWMTNLNRLPTKDRLMKMGMTVDGLCGNCRVSQETRNHLFFECHFSRRVWGMILQKCFINRNVMCWDEEIRWAVTMLKGKSLVVVILKLALGAFVYRIWEERNFRQFRNTVRSIEDIVNCIKQDVCIRISGEHIRTDDVNRGLCAAWGIPI
ncbi:hypothetical protein GQ457_03G009480 [Hibiscus cannabinus]